MTKRFYLAGPEVFSENAATVGARRCETLEKKFGMVGLFPFNKDLTKHDEIYKYNVELLKSADAVLANLTMFRGPSCDVGTAVEIGMANALGIPVFGYDSMSMHYKERVYETDMTHGYSVEDFGLTDNLMVINSCQQVCRGFNEAALAACKHLIGESYEQPAGTGNADPQPVRVDAGAPNWRNIAVNARPLTWRFEMPARTTVPAPGPDEL